MESFIKKTDNYVLALGGGTPCYYDNFSQYQKEDIKSFYLKGSVSTLSERLKFQKNTRPILVNLNDERNYFYNQVQAVISVDNKNEQEIVSEILSKLA